MYTAHTMQEDNSKKLLSRIPFKKVIPALIVLIAGTGLSYVAKNLMDYKVHSDRQVEFDKSVSSVVSRLESGVTNQQQVVTNLNGLFAASVQVVRDVFELYSTVPARSNPYILSVGYASRVKQDQVENFCFYNRSERYFNYKVFPEGNRPQYEPITYIVPYETNAHLSGFDLLSNPISAEVVNRAQSKKGIVSSQLFNFRGGDTTSLFLVQTVEKKKNTDSASADDMLFMTAGDRFDGIIFVEIDAKRFFHSIIGDTVGSDKNIVFECFEKDEAGKERSIYSSPNKALIGAGYTKIIGAEKEVNIGDRTLLIRFSNAPGFGTGLQAYLGWMTLGAGVITTLVLVGFLISVITSKQRAMNLADRITANNRRILESSNDIIGVMDMSGIWKTVNPAIVNTLGYDLPEIENKHIAKFLVGDGVNEALYTAIENAVDEKAFSFDVQMKTKANDIRWISWSFTLSKTDNVIYAVGRDVTEAKKAEDDIKLKSKQVEYAEQVAIEANEHKSTFMLRLTDHLRDSLSDTLQGLHKISMQIDYSDDKQIQFLQLANHSSDQLFNIVNDLMDVAQDKGNSTTDIQVLYLARIINEAQGDLADFVRDSRVVEILTAGIQPELKVKADAKLLGNAMSQLFATLSEGQKHCKIQIYAQENYYENVLELQIMAPANETISSMIKRYNISTGNFIENLKFDVDNILFRLGVAASQLRRMNGNMSAESMDEEGNVVLITLPMPKNAD